MTNKIKFAKTNDLDFYSTLNKRVDEYFTNNKISKNANWVMVFKTFFYLTVLTTTYFILILGHSTLAIQFLLWIILGFFTAFVGLNISHDAIHGSLSRHKSVNKVLSYSFNIIGANAYLWSIMHNIVHHTYTNIEGHDEDIESVPLLQGVPSSKINENTSLSILVCVFILWIWVPGVGFY